MKTLCWGCSLLFGITTLTCNTALHQRVVSCNPTGGWGYLFSPNFNWHAVSEKVLRYYINRQSCVGHGLTWYTAYSHWYMNGLICAIGLHGVHLFWSFINFSAWHCFSTSWSHLSKESDGSASRSWLKLSAAGVSSRLTVICWTWYSFYEYHWIVDSLGNIKCVMPSFLWPNWRLVISLWHYLLCSVRPVCLIQNLPLLVCTHHFPFALEGPNNFLSSFSHPSLMYCLFKRVFQLSFPLV